MIFLLSHIFFQVSKIVLMERFPTSVHSACISCHSCKDTTTTLKVYKKPLNSKRVKDFNSEQFIHHYIIMYLLFITEIGRFAIAKGDPHLSR